MMEKTEVGTRDLACRKGTASSERRVAKRAPEGLGRRRSEKPERVTVSANPEQAKRLEKRTALTLATRGRRKAAGLLFTGPNDKALLLVSCNDVHTVGMRHAIDVAFVDRAGLVVEAHRAVGPLRRLRNAKAVAVVERFASCDAPWFAVGDQVMISSGREAAL
ncbi:DUF192 domain-containing protein [Gordonibacter massiliensis (ex Traore et al. 2017)]|uniref:DUF192 domain-containing protein n=1 Tax=Gordonibacter massiliensis (ex Traore et al. 2017) TaxID=1841863 RepID=UPI001FE9AD7E|nr:DUF192 domain-containing protein [Gordonibacter massiliensis (ex Traore et al. 2017)]